LSALETLPLIGAMGARFPQSRSGRGLVTVHNFQSISAQGWSQTVTGVTVVTRPRIRGDGGGLERVPRGAQGAPGRVPERKRPKKLKEGAVCVLEKGRKKKKESKAHLKNVEPLWCP
jgi:hypothetical protein